MSRNKDSKKKRIFPLWAKISLISLAVYSLIFMISISLSTRNSIHSQIGELVDTHLLFIRSLSSDIEQELKETEAVVSFFASPDLLEQVFQEQDSQILMDYRSEMIGKCSAFYLFDFQGDRAFELSRGQNYYPSVTEGKASLPQNEIQSAMDQALVGRSSISMSYLNTLTLQPMFLISYPILQDGEVLGMLTMSYNLSYLWSRVDDLATGKGIEVYITNSQGLVVAHSDKSQLGSTLQTDQSVRALEGYNGFDEIQIDEELHIVAYGQITGRSPFALIIQQQTAVALEDIYQNVFFSSMLAIFGVLLILISSLILGKWFTRPVKPIVEAIKKVSTSLDVPPVETRSKDEFHLIAHNFNEMVEELREKENIKRMFGQYISSDIRDELLKGSLSLEGEEKDGSVLFSDIRGFTSLSERFSPKDLLGILNDYFAAMIKDVDSNHGIVNKFIGDALMVLYGVPISQGNHGLQAVESALMMLKSLQYLNEKLKEQHGITLSIGIGIATGKVIAGNIGIIQRREYSVIGDIVNVASRLEKATKKVNHPIIFTQETADQIKDHLAVRKLGRYHIRGKEQPLVLFGLQESEYSSRGLSCTVEAQLIGAGSS